jgi:uncharacterized protein YijF (DUF1287 family)
MKVFSIIIFVALGLVSSAQVSISPLAEAAESLTKQEVVYDPSYFSIPYPNGDVPSDRGVCTDVVVRAYRKVDVDLQRLVHEDMKANFHLYPKIWGLQSTDKNIDHRRVPNLMTFFERKGESLSLSKNLKEYRPGDIVCWRLEGNLTHIGIVSKTKVRNSNRFMLVHNIGAGQILEDVLFSYKIIGHYRY